MKNIIISAAILMLVCCGEAEATSKNNVTNQVIKPKETTIKKAGMYNDYTPVKTIEINLDDMTFTDAFAIEYRAKGEGHTFWWNNEQYTTDLAGIDEFVLKHVSSND